MLINPIIFYLINLISDIKFVIIFAIIVLFIVMGVYILYQNDANPNFEDKEMTNNFFQ